MKTSTTALIALALFAHSASADTIKTNQGQIYENATITRIEPDGINIKYDGGTTKIPFTDLSPEIQKKYNYNPDAAGAYQSQQAMEAAAHAYQKQLATPSATPAVNPQAAR